MTLGFRLDDWDIFTPKLLIRFADPGGVCMVIHPSSHSTNQNEQYSKTSFIVCLWRVSFHLDDDCMRIFVFIVLFIFYYQYNEVCSKKKTYCIIPLTFTTPTPREAREAREAKDARASTYPIIHAPPVTNITTGFKPSLFVGKYKSSLLNTFALVKYKKANAV